MHFFYVLFVVILCALIAICVYLCKKIVALRNDVEHAKTLANARGVFVNMSAHDFRNHLTTIKMAAEMLAFNKCKISPDLLDTIVRNITCGVQNLSTMINDMMLLGKLQYDQISFSPKSVNILQLCHEIAREHDKNLSRTELSTYDFVPNAVNIDVTLFRHILSNLLSNALKYSQKTVHINMSLEGKFLVLKVIDHGIGIPENDIPTIANIFERCANAKQISGTGLGMYIVSQCVNLHNGKMYIKSKLNCGTTVVVKLPCNQIL